MLDVKDGSNEDIVATACNAAYDVFTASRVSNKAFHLELITWLIRDLAEETEDMEITDGNIHEWNTELELLYKKHYRP